LIQRLKWEKPKKNLDFVQYCHLYTIESMINQSLFYIIDNEEFAIVTRQYAIRCLFEDMPELSKQMPKYRKEIMDIYREIPDLKRLKVI